MAGCMAQGTLVLEPVPWWGGGQVMRQLAAGPRGPGDSAGSLVGGADMAPTSFLT